jgi:hypothetical protein
MRNMVLAALLLAIPQSASAANVDGNGALALAALVAEYTPPPLLTGTQKSTMARLFNGILTPPPPSATIVVKADNVVCRTSNVDITEHSCALTFGPRTVNLKGRRAHELYATIGEVGVAPDGAAGSVFESLSNLNCTIKPSEIAERAGGGASCTFNPGAAAQSTSEPAKSTSEPKKK